MARAHVRTCIAYAYARRLLAFIFAFIFKENFIDIFLPYTNMQQIIILISQNTCIHSGLCVLCQNNIYLANDIRICKMW